MLNFEVYEIILRLLKPLVETLITSEIPNILNTLQTRNPEEDFSWVEKGYEVILYKFKIKNLNQGVAIDSLTVKLLDPHIHILVYLDYGDRAVSVSLRGDNFQIINIRENPQVKQGILKLTAVNGVHYLDCPWRNRDNGSWISQEEVDFLCPDYTSHHEKNIKRLAEKILDNHVR